MSTSDLYSDRLNGPIPRTHEYLKADPALDDGTYEAMDRLFKLMTDVPGVGWAKASKILHFKRPHLYPILDSRLVDMYQGPAALAAQAYPGRGFTSMYWAAIRMDVMANRSALRELRATLLTQAQLVRLADLSDVRMLDIFSWSR